MKENEKEKKPSEYSDILGQDSLTRFDKKKKKNRSGSQRRKDGKDPKVETPDVKKEEGKETLKIGGVEVKTTWMKYKSKTPTGEHEGQTWLSEDVPGGLVKSVSKAGDVSTKTELIEIKKP